jgi:hypothetical protein
MSWVNDNNCYILNTCINSQNIDSSNGDQILDTLENNWSGVTQAFQNGGCQAVQQMVNPNASACSNNQGLFFSGCPEGPSYSQRGSTPVPICMLPGSTCPYNTNCPSSESYVHAPSAPWTRPSAYLDLDITWSSQKPFQL